MAVPRPVSTGPTLNVNRCNDSGANEVPQERTDYFIEHEISTSDARKAAHMMKLSQGEQCVLFLFSSSMRYDLLLV